MTNPACTSCGQPLVPGSRFCGRCGAPISLQATSPQTIGQTPGSNTPFRGTQYIIDQKILAIRDTFGIYNSQGQLQAVIKKKILQLIGSQWWMENPSGQEIAKIHGNILEHDYKVQTPDGSQIAQIHKKWVSVRDSYCVEIQNQSLDPYLVLSYAISMDHAEKKEDHHSGLSPF